MIVTVIVLLASSWGIWEWGRRKDFWGTSDTMSYLSEQMIVSDDADFVSRIVDRSEHQSLFGKLHPQWVEAQISAVPGSGGTSSVDDLSQRLHRQALSEGWAIDDECSPDFLWCARRMDDSGQTLFMTVTAGQNTELKTTERMSGESERSDDSSVALRVRMQYL
ncbi:hypothetical protein G7Y41_03785 [Schaalia sp. ZJ405]|uniref:hypothetical protein n=1 Tax=Schaalia sp. ZJ405 TaxID=2709403 RepID=UPI0013ED0DD9|nr:hypothetical protein [Schaalia sp. ZJ405]QPK81945.1 hypothetical protein G7Y41_03785 [Schaalia sp. ZJ405]